MKACFAFILINTVGISVNSILNYPGYKSESERGNESQINKSGVRSHQIIKQHVNIDGQLKKSNLQQKYSRKANVSQQSVFMNSFKNATHWACKEEVIFHLAKVRYQNINEEVLALKVYTQDYESTSGKATDHSRRRSSLRRKPVDFVASGAILSYRMTSRYVNMLQRLKESLASNYLDTDLQSTLWHNNVSNSAERNVDNRNISNNSNILDWPSRIDLTLAMHSLIHIQEIYNYDYAQLPVLLSPETKQPCQLNAFHAAEIGLHALYRKHLTVAIEWMEHAVEKSKNEGDTNIPLPTLEAYLELTAKIHNRGLKPKFPSKIFIENLFTKPVEPFKSSSTSNIRISSYLMKMNGGSKQFGFEGINFNGICSGKDYRTPQELSALHCWYDRTSSPARLIQPYKKELLSKEPEVVQVYEFVGDKIISSLVNDKSNCSGISRAFDKAVLSQIMRFRTPTTCWPARSRLESFWRKVSSLTLTDLRTPGSHNVGSVDYLYGRFYNVHRDALQSTKGNPEIDQKLAQDGDRLISMVVYLNDVHAGGWTPFPTSGTAALPIKGSVVFWNNLYRNGTAREDTWHGACPVVYGHKQVAVVLLRSHSQLFTYPCTLNRNE